MVGIDETVRPGDGSASPAIAVDGLSGAGKSTLSRAVAGRLGWGYLDTGATYRAVTLGALRAGLVRAGDSRLRRSDEVVALTPQLLSTLELSTRPDVPAVRLGADDVTTELRGDEVTATVSAISAEPRVRRLLVDWQRRAALSGGGCVVEGRDVGTVVLPHAPLKIWLTAGPEDRASRRAGDLAGTGGSLATVRRSLARRDGLDSSRQVAPAHPAADAVVLDSSGLAVDDVIEAVLELASARGIHAGSSR